MKFTKEKKKNPFLLFLKFVFILFLYLILGNKNPFSKIPFTPFFLSKHIFLCLFFISTASGKQGQERKAANGERTKLKACFCSSPSDEATVRDREERKKPLPFSRFRFFHVFFDTFVCFFFLNLGLSCGTGLPAFLLWLISGRVCGGKAMVRA